MERSVKEVLPALRKNREQVSGVEMLVDHIMCGVD